LLVIISMYKELIVRAAISLAAQSDCKSGKRVEDNKL